MYTLTLTREERRVIDCIGDSYEHGIGLSDLLSDCSPSQEFWDQWDTDADMIFNIPEHIAWQIKDIGKESNYLWDCFGPELREKLNKFCEAIVFFP